MKKIRTILLGVIAILSIILITACDIGNGENKPNNEHITHNYTTQKSNETKHWNECSCGAKSDEESHTFGEWEITKEPTEESIGSKKRICFICNFEENSSVDKLVHQHTFSEILSYDNTGHWFPATCVHINERSNFEKHTFSNGICSKCKMNAFLLENQYFDVNTTELSIELVTKRGYNCLGVFDKESGVEYFDSTGRRSSALVINAGQNLEMCWEKKEYTLHYIVEEKEIYSQTIEFENALPALPKVQVKEGFDFLGWFDKNDKVQYGEADGKYKDDFSVLNSICKYDLDKMDIYLYGRYKKQTFTVCFYDIDDNIILTQIVGYGENAIFNQDFPSKIVNNISYTFDSWDTSLQNIKSNLEVRPICSISISNPNIVFDSIKADYNPINILPLNFGAHYELGLNPDKNITLRVYSLDGDELSDVIILNDDMSLDVVGLISYGEFNLFYKEEKLFSENIEFDMYAGQLGAQIRKILIDKGIQVDVITEKELSLIEDLDLSEHFKNNNEMNYVLGIKYLTGLKRLNISNNDLDEEYIRNILPTLKELVYLDISKNYISNLDVLNENRNLIYLDASSNLINSVLDSNSVESLRRLRKLETLNLNNNEIADLSPIANLMFLKELKVSNNKITAKSIDSLVSLWNLKCIDLSYNQSLSDMSSLYSLKYITDLESVDLSGISMNGQFGNEEQTGKINRFPTSTTLKNLVLEDCNLTNSDLTDLTKFINLKDLNISSNEEITQDGLYNYFIKLGEYNKLESLNMSNLDKIRILPEFTNMSNLKKLTFNELKALRDISNLKNSSLSNLEELSFNDCRNIEYSSKNLLDIFDCFTKLRSLSIANALEWIDRGLYDHLLDIVQSNPRNLDTINPNDLKLQLFDGDDSISFDSFLNYRKKVIFGIEELFSNENSKKTNQNVEIKYQEDSSLYDLVISFLNDSEEQSNQIFKLIIPNGYQSLTIYGRTVREYNIAIDIEDRKDSPFSLNLHTFVTKGLAKTATIKTNSECKLTINAYGDKVIIKGANGVNQGEEGCNAIEVYDLVLNSYTENFSIQGGNGIAGANGYNSEVNQDVYCWNRSAYNGGSGGTAIICHNIVFKSAKINVAGGNGANGGKGGTPQGSHPLIGTYFWDKNVFGHVVKDHLMEIYSGGNGGNGGNGGDAIRYSGEGKNIFSAILVGGFAGQGGSKGNANGSNNYYHDGPWFGEDGKPGQDGKEINKVGN